MGDPITSQAIVQAVATPIKDTIFEYVKRHSSYLFSYKGKIKKLQEEIEELRGKRDRIQGKVDRAKNSAQVIENDVLLWLTNVQPKEKEVDDFLADESKEKKQCFKGMCPNLIWRHWLGKPAEEITITVVNLKERGGKFESSEVAHPAPFPAEMLVTSSEDYMNFDSRNSTFLKILEALKDSDVKMILVHGPGGVGKTRMVKEATKQVNKGELFEQVLEATISTDPNVKDIQEHLAAQLNLDFDKDDVIRRKAQLYTRLKQTKKRVLVIIDDVWKKEDMDNIGVPFTDCKILVTTRHESLCERKPDQKDFSIGVLKEMEAWEFFKKIVGDISVGESMAKQVCKECGGLPIAVLAVGATLKGKETHAWKNALNKLKNSNIPEIPEIDPKIYTSLKLSYDNLNHVEKSLFLLFCLFPEGVEVSIDDLVRYSMALQLLSDVETLEEARYSVHASVDTLKSSYLLLHGKNKYFAKMHDIIRDVAIYITKRKDMEHGISMWPERQQFLVKHNILNWPKKGTWEFSSAISLRLRNVNAKLPNDFCCPELHTLILELGMLKVPQRFFAGTEKVTVLVLINMCMLFLPLSLANLVNLRMLFLNNCELKDMTVLENLKDSIEILSLKDSKIEVLPSVIGQLTCLRLLDLENVWPLKVIRKGVFSKLLNLEELYVSDKFKNWGSNNLEDEKEINASQITTLNIHMPNVEVIHKNFHLERLTRFRISVGNVSNLSEGYFSSTRILRISIVHIKDELKILLERTEELYLTTMEGLNCLEHLLGEPKCSSRSFSELTVLYICNCGFKYLFSPSCARSLRQLQRLEIRECINLERVIGIEGEKDEKEITTDINFSHLKWIKMVALAKLVSFYGKLTRTTIITGSSSSRAQSLFDDQVALPTLEELIISELPNISSIWEQKLSSTKSVCQLRRVRLDDCKNHVNLVPCNMLQTLRCLEVLDVEKCQNLEFIVTGNSNGAEANNDNAILLPRLTLLDLRYIKNLKGFCDSSRSSKSQPLFNHQVVCPALKTLDINGLYKITEICEDVMLLTRKSFCQLETLHVWNCKNMEGIVSLSENTKEKETTTDSMIEFAALESISLKWLDNFKSFYNLESKTQPLSLFNHQVEFPNLHYLEAWSMKNIEEVWSDTLPVNSFGQLRQLLIGGCNKLASLASSKLLARLQSLQDLQIVMCDSLQVIFRSEGWNKADTEIIDARDRARTIAGNFASPPQLKTLEILGLPSLESFFSESPLFQLPSTVELIIKNCPKWGHVPD